MNNMNFFEDIGEVSAMMLNEVINHTPIGTMILMKSKKWSILTIN